MSDDKKMNPGRRNLIMLTVAAGGAAGVTAAVPFALSMEPSEAAKAAGAPVEADLSDIPPGSMKTVAWRGQPVWILHRTPEMLAELPKLDDQLADPKSLRDPDTFTPPYARNENRSIKPEYLVVVGICTHLGCSPVGEFAAHPEPFDPSWQGGFYCPCHGSTYDLAGRVYRNKPAPDNLKVPKYMFLSDSRIVIGKDEKGEA
jgi:ubiquinol-cytochrome c reductase iron-sulfur subunit